MIFRDNVTSTTEPRTPEWNAGHVYIRYDMTTRTVDIDDEAMVEYVYKEIYMTENEYNNIRMGTLPISVPEWTDQLRIIERSELYRHADDMIMKYSTDVPDDAKKQAWIQYKHSVRTTQHAQGYPANVTYPSAPE